MSGDAEDYSWNWVDRINDVIPIPYPLFSLIIGISIYIIYDFFSRSIWFLTPQWTVSQKTIAAFLCLMIAFQFAGITFLMNKMKMTFSKLDALWIRPEDNYLLQLKKRFAGSYWYYVLLAFVIVPFYLIDIFRVTDGDVIEYYYQNYFQCYFIENNFFNLMFDIFNNLVGFLIFFMLSIALWIMINLAWSLKEFSEKVYDLDLNRYITDIEMSLKAIREALLHVLSYYFIMIFLFIINFNQSILSEVGKAVSGSQKAISIDKILGYINPTFENILIVILLIIGVAIFFVGINSLNSIFNSQLRLALAVINKKSQEHVQKLTELQLSGDSTQNSGNLNYISSMLDALQKQRERLLQISSPGYSLKTVGTFVTAFLIPFVTFIDKVKPGMTADIMNQIYTWISSIIPI